LSGAVAKLASITFSRLSLLSKNDKPWFLLREKPCCYIHHTFLLGFPTGWSFTTHHQDGDLEEIFITIITDVSPSTIHDSPIHV
jgi:hypothetical protein